ncbi:MAG: rhomboid family intramembrane serine protease [Alphaproteobacteria bacterium]|nr:rhomboid family intramembrane serine protease [Alphaproteobacteria bacterium]MBE8220746.1 rhomboid family intramembrane serine protease [Alphaproteobacteria bacterium]
MRIPFTIAALIASFVAVQLSLVLFPDYERALLFHFALFPARVLGDAPLAGQSLLGVLNLLSYGWLHGGWGHCAINSLWLLAFGTPLARRMGALRFLIFYCACVVLAGLGQVLVSSDAMQVVPIIGASGGVAACMGGALRFAFIYRGADNDGNTPLLPLRDIPRTRPVLMFILIWVIFNVVFGLTAPLLGQGEVGSIAWQAHLVGFFAGLCLLRWFDAPPRSPSGGPGQVPYGQWRQ